MQKLVYLSNSRDYTEQGNINKNKYFTYVNRLLDVVWNVAHMTHDVLAVSPDDQKMNKETYVSFVLLEKSDDEDE